jgi:hypothetical protein
VLGRPALGLRSTWPSHRKGADLTRYGPTLVFLLGVAVVAIGFAQEHREMVVWGGALAVVGALAPRLTSFKASPTGVQGEFVTIGSEDVEPAVTKNARDELDTEETEAALTAVRSLLRGNEILIRSQDPAVAAEDVKDQVVGLIAESIVRASDTDPPGTATSGAS